MPPTNTQEDRPRAAAANPPIPGQPADAERPPEGSEPGAARVDVSGWTIKNPDGKIRDVNYDILRRRHEGRKHSALVYIRDKLRCWKGSIDAAGPRLDLVCHRLILPPAAPDLYLSAEFLWSEVDRNTNWEGDPHLLAGPTLWFPAVESRHRAIWHAEVFAREMIADRYGVAVHLIAHDPARQGKAADFHVHLLATVRQVTGAGPGAFVRELVHSGCHRQAYSDWEAWKARRLRGTSRAPAALQAVPAPGAQEA